MAGLAIRTSKVTVGTTVTLLAASRPGRTQLILINEGTTDVRIGNKAVTSSTGALLSGVKGQTLVLETGSDVYGIVGAGTHAVSVIETA